MHSPCPFILIWRQVCARRYISSQRNINNLKCAEDTTLMEENEEELKSHLMRVKEKSGKAGLNSTIKKEVPGSGGGGGLAIKLSWGGTAEALKFS